MPISKINNLSPKPTHSKWRQNSMTREKELLSNLIKMKILQRLMLPLPLVKLFKNRKQSLLLWKNVG